MSQQSQPGPSPGLNPIPNPNSIPILLLTLTPTRTFLSNILAIPNPPGNLSTRNGKRKWKEHAKFKSNIKEMTCLDMEPAPDINNRNASYCMTCSEKHARNETGLWIRHAKICTGLIAGQKEKFAPALSAEAQHL